MRYSIIIPCYERADELRRALQSCLAQSFPDWEAIVVDDCSPTPLISCCESFADSRIRYIRNSVNLGAARSRNAGLEAARGDYVSFLDSDDVYFPQRLATIETALAARPVALVFHRQQRVFDSEGNRETSEFMPKRMPEPGERLDEFMLLNGNYIQTNSYAIERGLAQRFRFDADCKAWEDNKYLLECWLASNDYLAIDEALSRYNDIRKAGRLSKQRDRARHLDFLEFAEHRCSKRAADGLRALVDAELPLLRRPVDVLVSIYRGWRAGVSAPRCAIYLSRSLFGFARTEAVIYWLRKVKQR